MSYLIDSARKVGRFFSPPVTSFGKRKAGRCEDDDPVESDSDSTSDTLANALNHYTKRICTSTTVVHVRTDSATQNASEAMQRARNAMTKTVTPLADQTIEQGIQEELERQTREELCNSDHQKKQTIPANPRKGPVDLTAAAQWSTKPNTRARQVLKENNHKATALLEDLQEPEYACRDAEIRDRVWQMMDQIEAFAEAHFSFQLHDKTRLRAAFESMPKETVKIIGCVASGGPAGARGWEDLFIDNHKRQALVCAIIGNVLVEQVFQHIFFGGTKEQIDEVAALQSEHRNADGFDRTALYATTIRRFLTPKAPRDTTPLHLPADFNAHITHILAALLTHLNPIFSLHPNSLLDISLPALHTLTTTTALLALHMRLTPYTAYHHAPIFKNQPFTSSDTECINRDSMTATHPHGDVTADHIAPAETTRSATLSTSEIAHMKDDQPLVQIALLPRLTAYRVGGGADADGSTHKAKGITVRRLTDAWAYCRWGRERVWKCGRPADVDETHGVAWEGGFVEFFPGVAGVGDPEPHSVLERARARARV